MDKRPLPKLEGSTGTSARDTKCSSGRGASICESVRLARFIMSSSTARLVETRPVEVLRPEMMFSSSKHSATCLGELMLNSLPARVQI